MSVIRRMCVICKRHGVAEYAGTSRPWTRNSARAAVPGKPFAMRMCVGGVEMGVCDAHADALIFARMDTMGAGFTAKWANERMLAEMSSAESLLSQNTRDAAKRHACFTAAVQSLAMVPTAHAVWERAAERAAGSFDALVKSDLADAYRTAFLRYVAALVWQGEEVTPAVLRGLVYGATWKVKSNAHRDARAAGVWFAGLDATGVDALAAEASAEDVALGDVAEYRHPVTGEVVTLADLIALAEAAGLDVADILG